MFVRAFHIVLPGQRRVVFGVFVHHVVEFLFTFFELGFQNDHAVLGNVLVFVPAKSAIIV
jgi:hypothetical protein